MFRRDSPAPPLGHTMATITNRGSQSTMQSNKTSRAVEGHRTPRPHRRHEPPRDRSTTISTKMIKGLVAATDHFHRHHSTLQQPNKHSNSDIKLPTTELWLQKQRPKGDKRHQDAIVVRSRDGSEAFARGTRMSGQGSFPMTPS